MNEKTTQPLLLACLITVFSSYFYVCTEWLFFATKPSMLNYMGTADQLRVLAASPLPLAVGALLAVITILLPLTVIGTKLRKKSAANTTRLLSIIPALLISSTEFILIENFSYTIFGIGVFTFTGIGRILHTVLFLALLFYNLRLIIRLLQADSLLANNQRLISSLAIALPALSILTIVVNPIQATERHEKPPEQIKNEDKTYDNVLIFASDGIDARAMSLYGYHRPTTPFIETMKDESLVFENHFTNSGQTTGSVGSLLSGKLPTTTRVLYPPDVFTNIHTHQHIPAYLRQYGFVNGDFTMRHYVDPYDLNMRDAFHYANGRNLERAGLPLPQFFRYDLPSTTLFLEAIYNRISSRMLHIFGLRTMYNPYLAVTKPDHVRDRSNDNQRVERLKRFIVTSEKPFFANVHLMHTHGNKFPIKKQVFSAGKKQEDTWDKDFYDDAVLQYDRYTEEIVEFLKQEGLYDSTLLILTTDHGFRWGINRSLPLIIRYPNAEHTGVIRKNSQRLDIAPTILDHLDIPIPDWVEGQSLSDSPRETMDPIYIAERMPIKRRKGWQIVEKPKPPFYTLGTLHAVYCDRIYRLNLIKDKFSSGPILDHSSPCSEEDFPPEHRIHLDLIDHLRTAGYDVGGLREPQ